MYIHDHQPPSIPRLHALLWLGVAVGVGLLSSCGQGEHQERRPLKRFGPVVTSRTLDEATRHTALRLYGQEAALHIQSESLGMITRLFDRRLEPEQVDHYVQKRGETLRKIANLYKIYHHEILALNPGVDLDRPLTPHTPVVLYRFDPERPSESIGDPSRGKLQSGVPMMRGPGRKITAHDWKTWASAATIEHLDYALRQWARRYPNAPPVLVNNLSARKGKRLKPHGSHQSGRDVDLSYILKWDGSSKVVWRKANADNLDPGLTWALLELLVETGGVEVFFVDYEIQKLLHAYATENNRVSPEELAKWLQYPRGRHVKPRLVEHVHGHVDHIHVRFKCPPDELRCTTRRRPPPIVSSTPAPAEEIEDTAP